jgi:ribosomal protein S18 acetylase RimI-like enzyme
MTFCIRRLGTGDEATLALLVHDHKHRSLDATAAAELLARSDVALFAAFVDDVPAGFALAYFLPRVDRSQDMAYLHELDVAPRARRLGLGRGLVEAVQGLARERGAMEVWVIAEADNEAAIATYCATGFSQEGAPAVVFGWSVPSGTSVASTSTRAPLRGS